MVAMSSILDELKKRNGDAYVVYDTSDNEDMRYLSGFLATDPYFYILKRDGSAYLIVSSMEELRARQESSCSVITRNSLNFSNLLETYSDPDLATAHMLADFCGERLLVPYSMPVGFARALSQVVHVEVDTDTVLSMRSIKTPGEIEKIRSVQRRNEQGVRLAIAIIRRATVDEHGGLCYEGAPLTSEKIRSILHEEFYRLNLDDIDTIISCGEDTALPHAKGTGQLRACQPIVMDVFPRDRTTGYFADMTRTVSKGRPAEEIVAMYAAVHEAKERAAAMIHAGVKGSDVHNAVVSFFQTKGYETAGASGFIHSLGHGVGLAIHELPSLSLRGGTLNAGNVVTIEPGLYYPGTGGVRLEDMGAVTEDGFDRFTIFEEELIIL